MHFIDMKLQVGPTGELEVTLVTGKVPIEKMNCFNVVGKGVLPGKLAWTHFTFVFLFLFMNSLDVAFKI